jgi:RimJ/RimL family protein N-acetyltransferase
MDESFGYFMESERLGFRHWQDQDFSLADKLWGNPEVTRWIHAKGEMNQEEIWVRFQKEINLQKQYGIQYWPVFLKNNHEFVGCCGVRPYEANQKTLELGAHFLPIAWGKGYAVEASLRVIDYCRDQKLAEQLFAGHHPKNIASARVLYKLGFEYTHDEYYPPTGLMHPSYRKIIARA